MDNPLLSIVIANYNYGRYLEDAIQSVVSQGMDEGVELIICDAGSTDNSVEIIKKYAKGLPPNTDCVEWYKNNPQYIVGGSQLISWWCSEKDGGQSAAFNKGFAHARGEWLTWLNADDFLLPGSLSAFSRLIKKHPKSQWITSNKLHFDCTTGKITRVYWGPHIQPAFLNANRAISAVFGPSTFFRKSVYERIGPIDERFHYVMDSAYWAQFTMAGIRQTRLNCLCWACRVHNESKTWGVQSDSVHRRREEETAAWRKSTGYRYEVSIRNVWYIIWLLWRLFDGSLIRRYAMKRQLEGKAVSEFIDGIVKG